MFKCNNLLVLKDNEKEYSFFLIIISSFFIMSRNSIKDPAKVSFRATPLPASETISRPPPLTMHIRS